MVEPIHSVQLAGNEQAYLVVGTLQDGAAYLSLNDRRQAAAFELVTVAEASNWLYANGADGSEGLLRSLLFQAEAFHKCVNLVSSRPPQAVASATVSAASSLG